MDGWLFSILYESLYLFFKRNNYKRLDRLATNLEMETQTDQPSPRTTMSYAWSHNLEDNPRSISATYDKNSDIINNDYHRKSLSNINQKDTGVNTIDYSG